MSVNTWSPRWRKNKPDDGWSIVESALNTGRANRLPFERQWQLNIAFLAGRQRVVYNTALEQLQHIITQKGKKDYIDNKLLPHWQKQVSRLIRTHPRMSVVPASADNEDIKAAKKGDRVLKWFWRQHKMRKKVRKSAIWIYSTGNVFLEDVWADDIGPIETDENGDTRYMGDAEVRLWSPFEMLFPVGGFTTSEIDDLPWIGKERFYTLEWIQNKFPEKGGQVTAESRPKPISDVGVLFGADQSASVDDAPGATVVELRFKPGGKYPRGKRIIAANKVILFESDWADNTYHIEQFKDIEVPGIFYGMATSEAGIYLQKLWNRTLGDLAEFNRVIARGKWLIPRNSNVETKMNDEHGQEIHYSPVMGHKPEIMTIKGLPQTYVTALEIVAQSLMELFHQHEVTQGTNKSDIRSGEMVALLLEQDDSGNIPTHAIFEEGLESLMSRILERVQRGYTQKRIIAVTGNSDSYDVEEFTGADLRNNTDVHVVKDSTLPESKIGRQMQIRENYKEGLYGNPNDPRTQERVLKMLDEVPDDIKDIFAEKQQDRQIARMENNAIRSNPGAQIVANNYDDHEVHMEEHRMARKEPEYQKLKFSDAEKFLTLEIGFITHQEQHQKFLEEAIRAQEAAIVRQRKLLKEA